MPDAKRYQTDPDGLTEFEKCDSAGTVVPGSSATNVVDGARLETPWAYVKITATTASCTVSTV